MFRPISKKPRREVNDNPMVSQDDDFGIPRCRVVDAEAYLPVALVPDEGRQEGEGGSQIEARFASAEAQFREGPFDFTPEMKNMLPDGIFNPIEGGPATEREYLRQHGWLTRLFPSTHVPKCTATNHMPTTGWASLQLINTYCKEMPAAKYIPVPCLAVDSPTEAVYQKRHMCIEYKCDRFSNPTVSNKVGPNHHSSNHTDAYLTFQRKKKGVYLFGNSHQWVHSEVFENDLPSLVHAGHRGGKKYIQVRSGVYNLGGHPFVLRNGEDPHGIIEAMDLPRIFYDSCMVKKGGVWQIIERGTRGNRGYSIGRTSGRCLKTNRNTNMFEPRTSSATHRYPRLWVAGSDLLTILSENGNFKRPMSDDSRNQRFSRKLHPLNEGIEHMSILTEVHDSAKNVDLNDLLLRHLDLLNCWCKEYGYVVAAWDTFFVKQLGRYVTMVVVWTSRKSIAEFIEREERIVCVAKHITGMYEKIDDSRKTVTADTLPAVSELLMEHQPFVVAPVHLDPLVDLSPCIYWMCRVNQEHVRRYRTPLDSYMYDDLAYAFLMTNNRLRFDRFMEWFVNTWEDNHHFPLVGQRTFTGEFIRWLIDNYGCYHGTNLSMEEENEHAENDTTPILEFGGGVTRHQPNVNDAQPEHKTWTTLHMIHFIVNKFNRKRCYSEKDCRNLFREIQANGLYMGDLTSVKLVYILAAIGRIDREVLKYCEPGSDHVKHFKEAPFFLTCKEHLVQVFKYLSSKPDTGERYLLPAIVDEILCLMGRPGEAVYIRGRPVYSVCVVDNKATVKKHYLTEAPVNGSTFHTEPFVGPASKDITNDKNPPCWAWDQFVCHVGNFSHVVYMSNKKQWSEDVVEMLPDKFTNSRKVDMNNFTVDMLHPMMYNGQFFAIMDPVEMVCDKYNVRSEHLLASMEISESTDGFCCRLSENMVELLDLENAYHGCGWMRSRTPRVELRNIDEDSATAFYATAMWARMAEMYNLLFNHYPRGRKPFGMQLLKNCSNFLIVFPRSPGSLGHGVIYAIISRQKEHRHQRIRKCETYQYIYDSVMGDAIHPYRLV